MDIPIRRTLINMTIFALVVVVFGEFLFRHRYATSERTATPLILDIQQYLELDDVIGFRWRPGIDADEGIVFEDGDAIAYPLSTDQFGFINAPESIARFEEGAEADIIGVGDSFMEHAAHEFSATFAQHGLVYRNMAMHRQAPQQFSDVVEHFALKLKPDLVVYSLYENDYVEYDDYENWEESGLNWFAFHSGTWCGTPLATSPWERRAQSWFKGYLALYGLIDSRLSGDQSAETYINADTVEGIADEILHTYKRCMESDIQFAVLLIPSRESATSSLSPEAQSYDRVLDTIGTSAISVIDLREIFASHSSPRSLYYEQNGHWNPTGMRLTAEMIRAHYEEIADESGRD